MNFRRNKGKAIDVNWCPKNGKEQPFEYLYTGYGEKIKYRGRMVATMGGKYFQVIDRWWDYHPDLNNGATLAPLDRLAE